MIENQIYFTTSTINKWLNLLEDDNYKHIIISSLQYLTSKKQLEIYAYIIMPNHFHIIWQIIDNSDQKESVKASFLKYTAHEFQKKLRNENPYLLKKFYVNQKDRKFMFWQQKSLDIEILNKNMFEQKMDYIHNNPVSEKYQLTDEPCNYQFSSAAFYETDIDEFGFLTRYEKLF